MRVAIVDTGLGNLHSVERAIRLVSDADVILSSDPEGARAADALVVPGQGAFRDCTAALANGLGEAIREKIQAGTPYLGICLGLQVLFRTSDEAPGCTGLDIFSGHVRRIAPGPGEKVPHTGWNTIEPQKPSLVRDWFYFVHSFVVVPDDPSIVASTTEHGTDRFVSAIEKDNVLAVQFHPEKSQSAGLALLKKFFRELGLPSRSPPLR